MAKYKQPSRLKWMGVGLLIGLLLGYTLGSIPEPGMLISDPLGAFSTAFFPE